MVWCVWALQLQHKSRTLKREPLHIMTQSLPFSVAKFDALLDQSGADALLASSKHNVQYLLGGYRYFFGKFCALNCQVPLSSTRRKFSKNSVP